jgi:DNA-binding protein YbaB
MQGIQDYRSREHELLRDGLLAVQQSLGEIRATHDSDDGLITATVGGRGELLELTLDPRIYRTTDSVALAEGIMATIKLAAESAADEAYVLTRHLLSDGATRENTDLAFDPVLHQLDQQAARGW